MSAITIKPDHSALDTYYARLNALKTGLQLSSEGSTRRAFSALLDDTAKVRKWTLAEEVSDKRNGKRIRLDGILYDAYRLPRGYWEAKDKHDDLNAEILSKQARDYPISNIIFEDTQRAVLIQDGVRVFDIDVFNRDELAKLLTRFYNYDLEPFEKFAEAVTYFTEVIPDIGKGLKTKIEEAHRTNKAFQSEFADFMELCRTSLNPNISKEAVDEMLIQHLLTERLIRKIFQGDFTRRNIIANKVEDVIGALTKPLFDRSEFQAQLDPFYNAIENAAMTLANSYQDKQRFINTVYERFFQGYSVKVADTHGIVYTPQEIVDFMCAAVEEVLQTEFGKKLGQDGVTVLDPATGTGNFIINLLNRVDERYRRDFYKNNLFANEVMLMPYYIASLNIEHAYYELEGAYEPFEGLCFVDTLDLARGKQMQFSFMTEANSTRVERQQKADITVIIGNPPYNVGQLNENDNNKNRAYEVIDSRVKDTYAKDSKAGRKAQLYDPYVKFFRWAIDRLQGRDGIVCYISNNSFIDQLAFDGMRKHLLDDFTTIYHLDLHGNVRQNPKLSGTTHNVFGIQVGVGVTVAVRKTQQNSSPNNSRGRIFYHRVPEFWTRKEKLDWLDENVERLGRKNALNTVDWVELIPNNRHTWLIPENADEYESFIPIGSKAIRGLIGTNSIFGTYSLGIVTNRDSTIYDYDKEALLKRMKQFIEVYNSEVDRYKHIPKSTNIDAFVDYSRIKWDGTLKQRLQNLRYGTFDEGVIRTSLYRPFAKQYLYFDRLFINSIYRQPTFFPSVAVENVVIAITDIGSEKPFMTLVAKSLTDLHLVGAGSGTQTFPFYVYDEDGTNRRENITDWALSQFRAFYGDESITKWDIFYYVYGLLHHPGYRERYADNLKRELPRIPLVPVSPSLQAQRSGEGFGVRIDTPDSSKRGTKYAPTRISGEIWEKLKPFARDMRKEPTTAENLLWQRLRGKRLGNFKFRRQHPVGYYIADFYCAEARLVVEVDGSIHEQQEEYDALRQAYVESLGLRVLRFTNDMVLQNIDGVLERIGEVLAEPVSPSLRSGEGFGERIVMRAKNWTE